MKVIYRHPIEPGVVTQVPDGQIRKVGFFRGSLCLWIEHEAGDVAGKQHVIGVPTGVPFVGMATYVDSALSENLVWHVYRGDAQFRLAL